MLAKMARDAIKGTAVAPEPDLEEMEWEDRADMPRDNFGNIKGPNAGPGSHLANKMGKAVQGKLGNKTNMTKHKTDLNPIGKTDDLLNDSDNSPTPTLKKGSNMA